MKKDHTGAPIVEYLRKGRDAGTFVLDPSDTELKTLRVVANRG